MTARRDGMNPFHASGDGLLGQAAEFIPSSSPLERCWILIAIGQLFTTGRKTVSRLYASEGTFCERDALHEVVSVLLLF